MDWNKSIEVEISTGEIELPDESTIENFREEEPNDQERDTHDVHEETTYEIAEKEKWEDYYRDSKLGAI